MNQKCKVCGEPAAGFHFGAFTCEGCKSFFGRTYSNVSAIGECKNGGQCVINKKNRTSCKACRLRKCLLVGMSKSGSRYGRRSNWFKIHCLLQEQTGLETPLCGNPLGSNLYNNMNSFSPEGNETPRTTPEGVMCNNDVNMSSSSSVTSSQDSTNGDDDTSKENLRLLLTSSPGFGAESNFYKRNVLRHATSKIEISELPTGKSLTGPMSPKAGLLAIGTPLSGIKSGDSSPRSPLPYHLTSPKLPESSSSGKRNEINGSIVPLAHPFYQLLAHSQQHQFYSPNHSTINGDHNLYGTVPEQDGPIDLSIKTQPVCHIRAEILTDIHILKENDAAPLDLTTKG